MRARSIVAVVVVVAMMSGCSFMAVRSRPYVNHQRPPVRSCEGYFAPVLDLAIASFFGALVVSAVSNATRNDSRGHPVVAEVLTVIGVPVALIAGSSIYGFIQNGRCRDNIAAAEKEDVAFEVAERRERARDERRERARGLIEQASAAARANNCDVVASLDREIAQLAPDFHATVFMRDVAIKRCLDAAGVAPPVTTPDAPIVQPAPPATQPGPTP